jgi:hypothetical protein
LTEDPKKKKRTTVKHTSLEWHRRQGHEADDVERQVRIPGRGAGGKVLAFTRDLFGFGDIAWFVPRDFPAPLEVGMTQSTVLSNFNARVMKAVANEKLKRWLAAGGLAEVHGWAKPTKTRKVWLMRRATLSVRVAEQGLEITAKEEEYRWGGSLGRAWKPLYAREDSK